MPLEGSLVEVPRTAANGLLCLLSLLREMAVNQPGADDVIVDAPTSTRNSPPRLKSLSLRYNFPPF